MPSRSIHVPPLVIQRLPRYLAHVQQLQAAGIEWVSSRLLAEQLGLTSSTVRQDFTHLDFRGTSRRGYAIADMRGKLERILGSDQQWNVVVAGVGNLGRALILHEDFARRGFHIRAVFDIDTRKIGSRVGGLEILPLREMSAIVSDLDCRIGILAVPANAAQAVADRMVTAGLTGLLNLAMTHVVVTPPAVVIDSHIIASLFELTHLISTRCDER